MNTENTSTPIQNNSKLVEFLPNVTGDKYQRLNTNRVVDEAHVRQLIESFTRFGTAGANVIVIKTKAFGNGKKYEYLKLDGQHTVEACNRIDLPYNVLVVELLNDTRLEVTLFMSALNNNKKAWSNKVFVNAFLNTNEIESYIELAELLKNSKLTLTDILHIFLGNAGRVENNLFREGLFTFDKMDDGKELLQATTKVWDFIPNSAPCRRSLFKVMRIVKDFDVFADAIIAKSQEGQKGKFTTDETTFFYELEKLAKETFKGQTFDFPKKKKAKAVTK